MGNDVCVFVDFRKNAPSIKRAANNKMPSGDKKNGAAEMIIWH